MRHAVNQPSGCRGKRGYTLLEMAIVMAVAGVLAGAFFSAYNIYKIQQIRQTTEKNASLISSALSNYLVQNGRYPCPARANAQRTDADYGFETQCNPTNAGYLNVAVGSCTNGICEERSDTTVSIDNSTLAVKLGAGTTCYSTTGSDTSNKKQWCPGSSLGGTAGSKLTIQPPVRRGMLPFRTLALPEDMALDGYKDRFWYAVSENQAVSDTYETGNGGVKILNAQGQPYFKTGLGTLPMSPDGDISQTNVKGQPSSPSSNVYSRISETSQNNSNYIKPSSYSTGATSFEVSLSNPTTSVPNNAAASLRFAAATLDSSNNLYSGTGISVTIQVKEGSTLIDSMSYITTGSWVSPPAWNFNTSSISNWNNVSVKFSWTNHTSGTKYGAAISWLAVSLTPPDKGYQDYVMFSGGKDRAGVYTNWGVLAKACPTTTLDSANCAAKAVSAYRMAERNDPYVADATRCNTTNCHYDDFFKFFSSTDTPLWRVRGNLGHIRDLMGVENTGGKGAIDTTPGTGADNAMLQVGGDVHAGTPTGGGAGGDALVGQICDTSVPKANCFSAKDIADNTNPLCAGGPTPQAAYFQCPRPANICSGFAGDPANYKYVVGFELGQVVCGPAPVTACPSGAVFQGVDASGNLICNATQPCPAKSINMCGTATTVPQGLRGQVYTTPVFGYNYTETYSCDSSQTPWHKTAQNGICNCSPVDTTYDIPCNGYSGPPVNGIGNWTGSVTMHHVHSCPADTDSVIAISNTCVCANTTETRTVACAAGFSGGIQQQRTWDCTTMTWSAWTDVPGGNTCTCVPNSQTANRTCPAGSTGTWTQQRDFACPAGSWGTWYDTTNTCTCQNGLQDGPYALSCPSGYTGSKSQSRYFDCSTNSWGSWVVSDSCTCSTATQTQNLACQVAYTGSIAQHRDFTCPAGTWGSWVTDSNTCTCTGATQTQTVPCDAPLAGTKEQQRTYNCGTDSWGTWADDGVNNCYTTSNYWTPKTAASGPFATELTYKAGGSCSTVGATQKCCASAGGGLGWYYYDTCQCE